MTIQDKPQIQKWMGPYEINFRNKIPKDIILVAKYSEILDEKTFKLEGFFYDGVGSSVAKIKDKNGIYVLKCSRDNNLLNNEFKIYNLWREKGVSLVKFYEFIEPQKDLYFSAILQEYIECPKTLDIINSIENKSNIFRQIGKNHAQMHHLEGKGFGNIVDVQEFKGKIELFDIFIEKEYRVSKTKDIIFSLGVDKAKYNKFLERFINNSEMNGVVIHNDLGLHNSFLCDGQLKIIDGDCILSDPMLDLANTCVWIWYQGKKSIELVINGYEEIIKIDKKRLYIAILIVIGYKLEWWYERVKSESKVENWINSAKDLAIFTYKKLDEI